MKNYHSDYGKTDCLKECLYINAKQKYSAASLCPTHVLRILLDSLVVCF